MVRSEKERWDEKWKSSKEKETHTLTLTHTHTITHTHSYTYCTLTLTYSYILLHTHAPTLSLSHTHTHTFTSLFFVFPKGFIATSICGKRLMLSPKMLAFFHAFEITRVTANIFSSCYANVCFSENIDRLGMRLNCHVDAWITVGSARDLAS